MALISSARERRLWLWLLVVLAAIYASMGAAQWLVETLRERNLLRVSMTLVVLLTGAAAAGRWLTRRPDGREIWTAVGVAAVYVIVWFRVHTPEERTHLLEYGLVAILIHRALIERRRNGRPVPAPAVVTLAATALLGWLDEGIKALLPGRVYDNRDRLFNALAGLMAISARLTVARARRWRVQRSR